MEEESSSCSSSPLPACVVVAAAAADDDDDTFLRRIGIGGIFWSLPLPEGDDGDPGAGSHWSGFSGGVVDDMAL